MSEARPAQSLGPQPSGGPEKVDRLIVHQFDAARSSPGGIDTCIRGILRYAASAQSIAVVGVDAGGGPSWRRLGQWERHDFGGGAFYFLPVARVDPADQNRRIPHSLRLIGGALRFRSKLPRHEFVQAHRADTAVATRLLSTGKLTYFIHTQESGLTGATSDSFWRRAGNVHERLELASIKRAERVAVFNPDYGTALRLKFANVRAFPTWYDPEVIADTDARIAKKIVWVGRLEEPKDPLLAVEVFRSLSSSGGHSWQMEVIGSGTLLEAARRAATDLESVQFSGRLPPREVALRFATSDVFLMTSYPGYEGFPRVLVEAMASGARPVVTTGADTGGLVVNGQTGFVAKSREASELARLVESRETIDRANVSAAVAKLSAPSVVARLYAEDFHQ